MSNIHNDDNIFTFRISNKYHKIKSSDVNNYLKQFGDFSAKNFRTWGANIELIVQIIKTCKKEFPKTKNETKILLNKCIKKVADKLHNTDTVCKNNYLDRLFAVYPTIPDEKRKIKSEIIEKIKKYYKSKNNIELFSILIKLELFPIKDSYVAFFKRSPNSIKNNPDQLKRICNRIYDMDLENLLEKIIEPKETNRQRGPMFKNWIKETNFCLPKLDIDNFDKKKNGIMIASDDQMKNYAKKKFDYNPNKGLDFIAKKEGKFIIGETKFLTDFGGHQNAQFNDAINVFKSGAKNCEFIAIMDGVVYIQRGKLYNSLLNENKNYSIFSALILDQFLKEFK